MTGSLITELLRNWNEAASFPFLPWAFFPLSVPQAPKRFRGDRINGISSIDREYLLKKTFSIPDVEEHFDRVRAAGRSFDVDLENFRHVLVQARDENCQGFSFNIDLSTALDPRAAHAFSSMVQNAGFEPRQVMLEITEHTPLPQGGDVSILGTLKDAGFTLAADDVDFRDPVAVERFLVLKPYMDVAKIDHHCTDFLRRQGFKDIDLSLFEGCQVIAEGIHAKDKGSKFLKSLQNRRYAIQYYVPETKDAPVSQAPFALPQTSFARCACA